jgi:hypothetical protein
MYGQLTFVKGTIQGNSVDKGKRFQQMELELVKVLMPEYKQNRTEQTPEFISKHTTT